MPHIYMGDNREKWVIQRSVLEFRLKQGEKRYRPFREKEIDERYGSFMTVWCGVDLGLFSYNKRPSFLVGKLSGRNLWHRPSLGGSVFRQIQGVRRKPLPVFAVFQVPIVQNNQNAKVACLRMVYFATLSHKVPYGLTQLSEIWCYAPFVTT